MTKFTCVIQTIKIGAVCHCGTVNYSVAYGSAVRYIDQCLTSGETIETRDEIKGFEQEKTVLIRNQYGRFRYEKTDETKTGRL